jgi:TolA-binding protein
MDTLQLLGLAGAATAGALVGAAASYWPLSRAIAQLRLRLERSEQARAGAVERSVQAREQIAQLNRAITELRRSHSHRSAQEVKREQLEQVLAESEQKTQAVPGSDSAHGFADTLPLPMA